ncbi:nuclear pore complex protein Nup50 [Sabethes cyaneus]|uniref:nuclear pore complex protein Nup50 n=1 Tax=Sabethes cyaneus TaxID=53552 RepID=UPI00237D6EF6|nr:nuclear pore complex protein Nup50 [Sabethes cyaneus]
MAKRGAQSDLNHDNWNEEEEGEEAGEFSQAPEEELKKRVFKTARRRGTGLTSETEAGSSVFSGFKGFSAVTSTPAAGAAAKAPAASLISFLSNFSGASASGSNPKPANGAASATTSPSAATGGSIGSATTSALGASIFAATDPSKKIFAGFGSPPKAEPAAGSGKTEEKKDAKTADYAASIKALNQSVSAWISDKVKQNPLCKLTPIFKDYEKYLEEIESKSAVSDSKDTAKTTTTGYTFPKAIPEVKTQEPAVKPFSFGFGSSTSTSSSSAPAKSGFTFANVAKPTSEADKPAGDAEEDEEPPKVEFTPVEEKDSLYSKRCKLFVKTDGNYSDRGIGTLHIKKVDSKVQVVVRADTNLGNILLNIILNEAIPLQRMGKNNVMMICLPTPESKPPPTSVLLRVKTAEEADELYETLNKHKPK